MDFESLRRRSVKSETLQKSISTNLTQRAGPMTATSRSIDCERASFDSSLTVSALGLSAAHDHDDGCGQHAAEIVFYAPLRQRAAARAAVQRGAGAFQNSYQRKSIDGPRRHVSWA